MYLYLKTIKLNVANYISEEEEENPSNNYTYII